MVTKSLKQGARANQARKTTRQSTVPPAVAPPRILSRVEQLGLLSKLEKAGALSALENAGVTLQFIEDNKLLTRADELGVISLVSDRKTPGNIQALGAVLMLAAVAAVVAIPDDSGSLVVGQAVLAGALGAGGVASLAGASLLADLQRE